MFNNLRWRMSGTLLRWGTLMIPHPVVREIVDRHLGAAGEMVNQMIKEAQEGVENKYLDENGEEREEATGGPYDETVED